MKLEYARIGRSIALKRYNKYKYMYILLIPVIAYFIVFHYVPMYGVTIAFKNYRFVDGIVGSPWAGFKHFERLFGSRQFYSVLTNTLVISFYKIIFATPAPIILALLLNEIYNNRFKKIVQTITYLPHFISWVVLGGIFTSLLSPSRGIFNFGDLNLLTDTRYFRSILVITHIWQSVGWGSIIYLAAIAGIDSEIFESGVLEGANRLQLIKYITIPSILPVISIVFILNLGGIMNAGFDQIFNMYNPTVYKVADIMDTYVYRAGLIDMNYSYTTAVGLFKNLVGLLLVVTTNWIIKGTGNSEYGLW